MTIYTWGYGIEMWEMLRASSFFVQNSFYMIASSLALLIFITMIKFIKDGQFGIFSFLIFVMAQQLFLTPSSQNFVVVDEATGYTKNISNIPLGLGLFLTIESTIEKALLMKTEASFSTPNGIGLRDAGVGFSLIAPLTVNSAKPRDRYLQLTYTHYINNCLLPEAYMGIKDINDLVNSENLKTDLVPVIAYETLVFDASNPSGKGENCRLAYADIQNRLGVEAVSYLNNTLPIKMGFTSSPQIANALDGTQKLIYGSSKSAQSYIEQEMHKNILDEGFKSVTALIGGDVRAHAYATAVAKQTTKLMWRVAGEQAKQNLPLVRSIGIALLVGVSSIVILFAISLASAKLFVFVFAGFFALALWSPIAAILNYQVYRKVEMTMKPLIGTWNTIQDTPKIMETLSMYLNNLYWWYSAIPMISYVMIAGGGMSAMYLLRDAGAGSASGADAGSGAGRGNYDYGNKNINNTTANKEVVVGGDGTITNTDTSGGTYTGSVGKDGSGQGWTGGAANDGEGGGILTTNTASGVSTVGINQNGEMGNVTWGNPNLANAVTSTDSSSISNAINNTEIKKEAFIDGISTAITDEYTTKDGTTDSESVSKALNIDKSTAQAVTQMVSTAETEAINNTMGAEERKDYEEKTGHKWEARAGVSTSKKIPFVDAGGGVSGFKVEDASGSEIYSKKFSAEEKLQYQENFQEKLAEQLSVNESVSKNIGRGISTTEGNSLGISKNTASQYVEATEHLDALVDQKQRAISEIKNEGVDINGVMLKDYIENDEKLNDKWNNAGNDKQRHTVLASAQNQIQEALLNPSKNTATYAKVQDSLDRVVGRYGGDVQERVDNGFNNFHGESPQKLKPVVDAFEVPTVNTGKYKKNQIDSNFNNASGDIVKSFSPDRNTRNVDMNGVRGAMEENFSDKKIEAFEDSRDGHTSSTTGINDFRGKEEFDTMEANGVIKQIGAIGSRFDEGNNFDGKIKNFSDEEIEKVLHLDHNSYLSHRLTAGVREKLEQELSDRAVENAKSGDASKGSNLKIKDFSNIMKK